jgi:CBS domain-containing protein
MTDAARLVTVSPEMTLKAVAELMLERRVSGVPVVDADGRVLGVISEADVIRGETGGTGGQGMIARARAIADPDSLSIPRTAGEAMSSPAVTIRDDETVVEAAAFATRLIDGGVYAVSFSFPVVPRGTARIRTQMSAAHTVSDLDFALDTFTAARG